jgi:hypothetical protein
MNILSVISEIPSALIGAVFGVLLPWIWKVSLYLSVTHWKKNKLVRTWYTYHFTYEEGKPILRQEIFEIKRNILGDLIASTSDVERPDLEYKGKIDEERNFIICKMSGIHHYEEYTVRFEDPIPGKRLMMWGMFTTVDFDNNLFSSIRLASDSKISFDEAEKLLRSRLKCENETLSIRYIKASMNT